MPRLIDVNSDKKIDLVTCVSAIEDKGFDPYDEESLHHAAVQLKSLYNDREFLTDIIMSELQERCTDQVMNNAYSGQVIMLHHCNNGTILRANIWPGKDHSLMQANVKNSFYFDTPHDHNFDFLTIRYMGPGYWSEYYEYEYNDVVGYVGESVDLKFIEKSRLNEGKILLYRAHRDVHHQLPADTLSVSINIMHQSIAQSWYDQYHFDIENKKVTDILNHVSGEVLMHMTVHLSAEKGSNLAREYARNHPSDRMRCSAWGALLSASKSKDEQSNLIDEASHNDSILVQKRVKSIISELSI